MVDDEEVPLAGARFELRIDGRLTAAPTAERQRPALTSARCELEHDYEAKGAE